MARTRVQEAVEAVVEAASAYDAHLDCNPLSLAFADAHRWFRAAVAEWRAAIAAQDVADPEVYLRDGAHESERQAAAAAMVNRPGLRKLVYEMLLNDERACVAAGTPDRYVGLSDRKLEVLLNEHAGGRFGGIDIPDRHYSHQSVSSARKSLVDAGLVYKWGAERVHGRRHIVWRARRLETT